MIKITVKNIFVDFDETLTEKSTINPLLMKGLYHNPKKIPGFFKDLSFYFLREYLKEDSSRELYGLISVLEKVPSKEAEKIVENTKFNLPKIRKCLDEYVGNGETEIIILSNNCGKIINNAISSIKHELDNYKIKPIRVEANYFNEKNGVFTGEIKIKVDKMKFLEKYENSIVIGDWIDSLRLGHDKRFINISTYL